MICNRFQIREVSGVRQFVVVNDLVSLVEGEDVADEIGTDKSGAAGYKDFHRPVSFGATSCASRSWDMLFSMMLSPKITQIDSLPEKNSAKPNACAIPPSPS